LGRMAHVPSVTRTEPVDVFARVAAQDEANAARGEPGRRVRLGLGAGSVW
jgi:hypothetical protein